MTNLLKLLLFSLCCYSTTAFAQVDRGDVDRLLRELQQATEDTVKAQLLNTLAERYWRTSLDTSALYAQQALTLVNGHSERGYLQQQGGAMMNFGAIHWFRGQYPDAMENYLEAFKIYQKIGEMTSAIAAKNNIALIHYSLKDFQTAASQFEEVIKLYLTHAPSFSEHLAIAYNSLGSCYLELMKLDEAYQKISISLVLSQEIQSLYLIGSNHLETGRILTRKGAFTEASSHLGMALDTLQMVGSGYYLAHCYEALSMLADSMNHESEKLNYAEKAYAYGSKHQAKDILVAVTDVLANTYFEQGQPAKAYTYLRGMISMKDSLFNEDKKKEIYQLSLKQKDAEIALERQRRELEEGENERKSLIILSVMGALISSIIVAVLIFRGRQKEKKAIVLLRKQKQEIVLQNEELKQQSEEIAAQRDFIEESNQTLNAHNKSITQSIQAALLIQQAMLPQPKLLNELFMEHFIFFRPRDIVSGDFYWVGHVEDTMVIAAIDCTGHGVPGAFMSMIGKTLLDEIVLLGQNTDPASILTALNDQVIFSLRQKTSNDLNGMDAAIISMKKSDLEMKEITFAGAKRPLYHKSPDSKEVMIVHGAKKSIGGRQNSKTFTNHVLQLKKGAMLYLGSDGLEDQHNVKNHKIGRETVLNKLNELVDKPCNIQHDLLAAYFDQHKTDVHQRDDVLLVGIRI